MLKDFIKEYRRKYQYSQADIAHVLNVNPNYIYHIERRGKHMSHKTACKFYKYITMTKEEREIFKSEVINQDKYLREFLEL
jgi:DNA-binding XRE family transcriptional regulator